MTHRPDRGRKQRGDHWRGQVAPQIIHDARVDRRTERTGGIETSARRRTRSSNDQTDDLATLVRLVGSGHLHPRSTRRIRGTTRPRCCAPSRIDRFAAARYCCSVREGRRPAPRQPRRTRIPPHVIGPARTDLSTIRTCPTKLLKTRTTRRNRPVPRGDPQSDYRGRRPGPPPPGPNLGNVRTGPPRRVPVDHRHARLRLRPRAWCTGFDPLGVLP
jgi:hypothetical protein